MEKLSCDFGWFIEMRAHQKKPRNSEGYDNLKRKKFDGNIDRAKDIEEKK